MNISTFSIVARDPENGQLAVAGTSNGFAYGNIVPYVESGVGAIATQAVVNLNYAAEGMLELREGNTAQDTMVHLLQNNPDFEGRHQVLIIDNKGNTACHTGEKNYAVKGHISKLNFACAGNTLVNSETLEVMSQTYADSNLPFALKIIKSLQAGHETGGDIRGIKSAAIKIVSSKKVEKFWEGAVLDLRTDESKNPLEKLEKLYYMFQANILNNKGIDSKDPNEALVYFKQALDLFPDNPEYILWVAKAYTDLGNTIATNELLNKVKAYPGHWMKYWEILNQKNK